MFTSSSFSFFNCCCNTENIHTQTQDSELALPDSLHKILISQNSSTGLGICPTPFEKKKQKKNSSLLFSLCRCLSGLPLAPLQSGNGNWICRVTKSWGIVFTSACQTGGRQLGGSLGGIPTLWKSNEARPPFPFRVTPPRCAAIPLPTFHRSPSALRLAKSLTSSSGHKSNEVHL